MSKFAWWVPLIVLAGAVSLHLLSRDLSVVNEPLCRSGTQCTVKVIRVIDGDTVVTANGFHIRFDGLDAPELDQDGGLTARACVEELIMHDQDGYITIRVTGLDVYGRTLGRVFQPNLGRCF